MSTYSYFLFNLVAKWNLRRWSDSIVGRLFNKSLIVEPPQASSLQHQVDGFKDGRVAVKD